MTLPRGHIMTVVAACRVGLAYYDHADRLVARMPPRRGYLWPDVIVMFPDGTLTERAPLILEWWRAGEAIDLAASWPSATDADLAPLRARLRELDREVDRAFDCGCYPATPVATGRATLSH